MEKTADVIVFAHQKGGSGKTTSCLSVAGYFAKWGHKTLVIDMDPQANATSGLGIEPSGIRYTLYDVILGQCEGYESVSVKDAILETGITDLFCVPAEFDLSVAEIILQNEKNNFRILSRALEPVQQFFDTILIDLPPSYGMLMINGLSAADHVVIPLDPSIYSLESVTNLATVLEDVEKLRNKPFENIIPVLIRYKKTGLLAKVLGRRNSSDEVESMLNDWSSRVFVIPDSELFFETQAEGIPVSHYAPKSAAGKAYEKLARHLWSRTMKKRKPVLGS